MTTPNLLAYKPVLFHAEAQDLRLASLPDYVLTYRKHFTTTCSYGHQDIPDEHCVCGIYTTIDLEEVERFITAPYNKPTRGNPYIPLMGIFQVLGKTVVQDDLTLRSWGAYLWGLVKPTQMPDEKWNRLVRLTFFKNRPIYYSTLKEANDDVCQTWHKWNLGG